MRSNSIAKTETISTIPIEIHKNERGEKRITNRFSLWSQYFVAGGIVQCYESSQILLIKDNSEPLVQSFTLYWPLGLLSRISLSLYSNNPTVVAYFRVNHCAYCNPDIHTKLLDLIKVWMMDDADTNSKKTNTGSIHVSLLH